jgi:hypothetical protein
MHWRSRIWPALLVSCAALISLGCRASPSSDAGITQADQHSAIVHAAGTVATVEEQAHDEQSYDLLPGQRVCFTIDSFAEVPSAVRNAYESAERERQAAHGPRCRDTSIDPSAVRIKVGDRVDVYFKLENAGQISIVRVSWRGVDL